MPNTFSAVLDASLVFEEVADPAINPGAVMDATGTVAAATGGRRWTTGTGTGKIGAAYRRLRTVASGATDSYDLLAAGSLLSPLGEAIDLDELKGLALRVTSGSIKFQKPGSNGLALFTSNNHGLLLSATAGLRAIVLDLGPDGLDVTVNSKFDIVEATGAATATYELALIGAE
tara:strand:+ start:216 stop:737 length:522 start_codon:yes stop_codon:yes gene_type:complete